MGYNKGHKKHWYRKKKYFRDPKWTWRRGPNTKVGRIPNTAYAVVRINIPAGFKKNRKPKFKQQKLKINVNFLQTGIWARKFRNFKMFLPHPKNLNRKAVRILALRRSRVLRLMDLNTRLVLSRYGATKSRRNWKKKYFSNKKTASLLGFFAVYRLVNSRIPLSMFGRNNPFILPYRIGAPYDPILAKLNIPKLIRPRVRLRKTKKSRLKVRKVRKNQDFRKSSKRKRCFRKTSGPAFKPLWTIRGTWHLKHLKAYALRVGRNPFISLKKKQTFVRNKHKLHGRLLIAANYSSQKIATTLQQLFYLNTFWKRKLQEHAQLWLAAWIKRRVAFRNNEKKHLEPIYVSLGVDLTDYFTKYLLIQKYTTATKSSILRFYLKFKKKILPNLQRSVKRFRSHNARFPFGIYKAFISELFHRRSFIFKKPGRTAGMHNFEITTLLGFRFMRRLKKLLTKRGGGHRAFNQLALLNYSIMPNYNTRRWLRFRARKFALHPFAISAARLKTYFFLRKFTKSRKTIFIPGMLKRRKHIRTGARWFANAVRKKNERKLFDSLLVTLQETVSGVGAAIELRSNFNEQVKNNTINIIPKRRRRRPSLLPFNNKKPQVKKKNENTKLALKKTVR